MSDAQVFTPLSRPSSRLVVARPLHPLRPFFERHSRPLLGLLECQDFGEGSLETSAFRGGSFGFSECAPERETARRGPAIFGPMWASERRAARQKRACSNYAIPIANGSRRSTFTGSLVRVSPRDGRKKCDALTTAPPFVTGSRRVTTVLLGGNLVTTPDPFKREINRAPGRVTVAFNDFSSAFRRVARPFFFRRTAAAAGAIE